LRVFVVDAVSQRQMLLDIGEPWLDFGEFFDPVLDMEQSLLDRALGRGWNVGPGAKIGDGVGRDRAGLVGRFEFGMLGIPSPLGVDCDGGVLGVARGAETNWAIIHRIPLKMSVRAKRQTGKARMAPSV
jgi:hypothetical protein